MEGQWISASKAYTAVVRNYQASDLFGDQSDYALTAERALIQRLRLGQLVARASTVTVNDYNHDLGQDHFGSVEIETVDRRFWEILSDSEFTTNKFDWVAGDFSYILEITDSFSTEMAIHLVELEVDGLSGLCDLATSQDSSSPLYVDAVIEPARGRRQKWDWDAALAHIVAIANLPDGLEALASGQLRQADIERAITEWFMTEEGDSPSISQIRPKASAIMRALAMVGNGQSKLE